MSDAGLRVYSRFVSTGTYLPSGTITNGQISAAIGLTQAEILERCGITERRKAGAGETVVYMGARSLERALQKGGKKPSDIERIIVATSTPDAPFPSVAARIAHELGIGKKPCYDISAACAGSTYLIELADAYLRSGSERVIAVIGAERMRDITRMGDKNTTMLFGDGAGSLVMEASEEAGVLASVAGSDGSLADILKFDSSGYMVMNGKEVFKFAARLVPELCRQVAAKAGVDLSQIKLIVPHQANQRIISNAAKALGIPENRMMTNIKDYGNTSAASVFIALDEAIQQQRIQRGDLVLTIAFGAGMSWAANLTRY